MQYFDSATTNAFLNGAGSDARLGDPRKQAQAVINYINTRGGLAGHKIVPVFAKFSLTGSETYSQQQTSACAAWTQDNHVAAAFWFATTISTPQIQECSRKKRFLLTHDGLYMSYAGDYTNPYFVVPAQLRAERWGPVVVTGLAGKGFFGSGAKVGILAFDDPASQAALRSLKQQLAARHQQVVVTEMFRAVQQTSDTGGFVTQLQSAVLKFRGSGVTHVMSVLGGGGGVPTFMSAAESQDYYPKYGLSSIDAPALLKAANAKRARTLSNTTAVGWAPITDVAAADDHGKNATAARCRAVLRGVLFSRTDEVQAMPYCDFFMLLKAATQKVAVGTPLTADALHGLVSELGASWTSAMTLATQLDAERRDGAAGVRAMSFASACSCLRYDSSQRRL